MKLSLFASLVACATAFTPAAKQASSTALKSAYENELGAMAPTGFFGKKDNPVLYYNQIVLTVKDEASRACTCLTMLHRPSWPVGKH